MLLLLTAFEPQQSYLWQKIRIGEELFQDRRVDRWMLCLPIVNMKDASFCNNQVRQLELTPLLQKIIQIYIDEHRPNLYMAGATNIFLLKSKTGNAFKKNPAPQMSEQAIYSLISVVMSNYLGIRIGPLVIQKITSAG
jgi:hypothetical protein